MPVMSTVNNSRNNRPQSKQAFGTIVSESSRKVAEEAAKGLSKERGDKLLKRLFSKDGVIAKRTSRNGKHPSISLYHKSDNEYTIYASPQEPFTFSYYKTFKYGGKDPDKKLLKRIAKLEQDIIDFYVKLS